MLQKDIRGSVKENEKALYEFGGWFLRLVWFDVPCPSDVGEAACPSAKSQDSIPEENSTLDPMRKPTENLRSDLFKSALI